MEQQGKINKATCWKSSWSIKQEQRKWRIEPMIKDLNQLIHRYFRRKKEQDLGTSTSKMSQSSEIQTSQLKSTLPEEEAGDDVVYVEFISHGGVDIRAERYRKLADEFTELLEKQNQQVVDAKNLMELINNLPAGTVVTATLD